MSNAPIHHTIASPQVGKSGTSDPDFGAPHDSSPEHAEKIDGSEAAGGKARANPNPGFDMNQPQELAPRDRLPVAKEPAVAPPAVGEGGTPVEGSALSREQLAQMTDDIIAALKTVYDPEIPSDIYELGLIYKIDVNDSRDVEIDMTLTAPACPVAGEMPQWVENAVRSVAGVGEVTVNLVFSPPWDPSRMSDEARLALNMF